MYVVEADTELIRLEIIEITDTESRRYYRLA